MAEVLSAPVEGGSHFSGLRRTTSHSFLNTDLASAYLQSSSSSSSSSGGPSYDHAEYNTRSSNSTPSSASSSPRLSHASLSRQPSFSSTPASSISDTKAEVEYEEDIMFPSYDGAIQVQHDEDIDDSSANRSPDDEEQVLRPRTGSNELPIAAVDDHAIENEPTRHVDYLSHEWREEDIWSSWRYIVTRRGAFSNSTRLENASWRTWAKSKNNLKTISPETLNWLKDCDVTWLYGPLQTDTKKNMGPASGSPPSAPSQLHSSASFIINKKPILKKRSTSEAILQRSISAHSLLKHAGAILKAQEASPSKGRPSFYRAASDFPAPVFSRSSTHNTPATEETLNFPSSKLSVTSSGSQTPAERRHIHFNNEVVQCIALEGQGGDYDEDEAIIDDDDEEDEGVVMMKQVPSRIRLHRRTTPRGSFGNDGKTIAPLPSTTLRGDTPEPSESGTPKASGIWPTARLLSSASQETLRPPKQSANFLLDDDDEANDFSWQPSIRSYPLSPDLEDEGSDEEESDPGPGMHRTASGMFMPYDEDEDEAAMNSTLFGKVVDTVNTARDIAHVIWNVGWRR